MVRMTSWTSEYYAGGRLQSAEDRYRHTSSLPLLSDVYKDLSHKDKNTHSLSHSVTLTENV